jgi:hypothetical protein
MDPVISLGVYRRLDNRAEGLSDDSPRALELHNLRKEALHEVLDGDPAIRVTDWGKTDDSQPHEFVELALGAGASAVLQYALVPGLKWLGRKLAEKAVDKALGELVKAVIARLRPRQAAKRLLDFTITLPDGTKIAVDPPGPSAKITIYFAGGSHRALEYSREKQ